MRDWFTDRELLELMILLLLLFPPIAFAVFAVSVVFARFRDDSQRERERDEAFGSESRDGPARRS